MSVEPPVRRSPEDVVRGLGIVPTATVAVPRHPIPLASRLSVGDLAWSSVGAASLAAATVAGAAEVVLDPDRIALAYASERYGSVDGAAPVAFAALSGFFRTSDGWVRTHGNYPHHARALRDGLGLGEDAGAEDATAALAGMPAGVAVQAITARGGIASAVFHERPDADQALRAEPLVRITGFGTTPPRSLAPAPSAPLAGVRILDLTRVIAGPVATRTLAFLGADVLRIDSPRLAEIGWQHLDTGHGKRSALLDLADPGDRARFDRLATEADVIVLGYRPDGLARLGLSPGELVERHPGIIVAQLSAWGSADRRGFDSIVQAASGISWVESRDGSAPGALPAQALDHSAGYLLAASITALLLRRQAEGRSWIAETSLRRVAAELLGMPRTAEAPTFTPVDPAAHTQTFEVDGSAVTTVAPAVAFAGGPTGFAPPRPWGRDDASWIAR
ncbi:carnitine dehydratase [Microbacterium sp. 4R-513]|uniref:CoA transferase n=1 Tax=Microbacterium sp. 4R-513 TaxID=2567934 RepID=UPI0013E1C04A|nr:CoA transferase [Microbacterium sp. 4R-513]QIG38070.1 carnitine dehydratase [Microbacterium sp. 4R-513]